MNTCKECGRDGDLHTIFCSEGFLRAVKMLVPDELIKSLYGDSIEEYIEEEREK